MTSPEEDLPMRRSFTSVMALAIYAVGVGFGMAALSLLNEPVAGKVYPRGLDFGLELIGLAWPLTLAASSLLQRRTFTPEPRLAPLGRLLGSEGSAPGQGVLLAAIVHWGYTFLIAIVFLFPRQLLDPILDFGRTLPQSIGPLVFGLALLSAIWLLASSVLLGMLRMINLTVAARLDHGERQLVRYAWVCGLIAVAPIVWLMSDRDPTLWLRPPATFAPELLGTFVVGGIGVATIARFGPQVAAGWSATSASTSDAEAGLGTRIALVAVLVAMLELGWLSAAARVLPGGLLPPGLITEATRAAEPSVSAADAASILRRVTVRTGFDAVGETFRIRWSDASEMGGFQSDRRLLADGTIRVRVDASYPVRELRALLAFQLASTLAELRYWPLPRYQRAGFAYWAAEVEANPFRSGTTNDWSAGAACADVRYLDFFAPFNEEILAPSSLPFLLAERRGGVRAAQDLLLGLNNTAPDDETWRSFLLEACGELLGQPVEDPSSPVRVEVIRTPSGPPPDGSYERRLLNEMKRRAGLSEGSHHFVIRYTTIPTGQSSISSFPDTNTILVMIAADQTAAQREQSLAHHFVGDLISVRYPGRVEPLQTGYIMWASRDPTDPFVTGRPASGARTAESVCRQAPFLDLSGPSLEASWLASAPFIAAERRAGEHAAQQLFRDMRLQGRLTDEWKDKVLAACTSLTT